MLRRLNFSLWYFVRPPWDSGISPPELMDFIAGNPASRAIDLGCGTGTNVVTLAQHGWQVTGVDFAPLAIQIAKRKARNAKVEASLFVGDVTVLKGISGPFDLALDMGCFHGIADRRAYLAELRRVLASGGHWLMYGLSKVAETESAPGLAARDLDLIAANNLRLIWRKDGVDKRDRASSWFLYQKY